jgi:hypothetical protein
MENIERTKLEIDKLVKDYRKQLDFQNDLELYVQGIKTTVEILERC